MSIADKIHYSLNSPDNQGGNDQMNDPEEGDGQESPEGSDPPGYS